MPSTSTMSSGTMKANSTALAPRSPRMRFFIPHLTALPGVRRRSGPRVRGPLRRTAATRTGAGSARGGELVGDLGEQLVELVAKRHDGRDDHGGDQADHEAVLDRGGALLLLEAVLGVVDEDHERDEGVDHGMLPVGVGRPVWIGRSGLAAVGA